MKVTKTAILRNLVAAVAAIAIPTLAVQSALAQCPSNPSGVQLATQTWPTVVGGTDYTQYLISTAGGIHTNSFGALTSIATDGESVHILDTTNQQILKFSKDQKPGSLQVSGVGLPATSSPIAHLFYVAGDLWGKLQDGTIADLDLSMGGLSGTHAIYTALNGQAVGETSDGQSIWVSTTTGYLEQIAIPALKDMSVQVTRSLKIGALFTGNLVYDGQYIWGFDDAGLVQFDPSTQQTVAVYPVTGGGRPALAYDGTYLYTPMGKFDPALGQIVSPIKNPFDPKLTDLFFDGSALRLFQTNGAYYARTRPCDNAILNKATLPNTPLEEVFDGTKMWVIYGTNKVSLR